LNQEANLMSRPSALRSRVAVFLCLVLLASTVPQAIPDPGTRPTDPERLRVAIGECRDGTGESVPGLAETLERSLRKSLADQKGVEVVSLDRGDPDRIVSARIAALSASRKGKAPEVQVVAESTDAQSREVAYRATVRAEGAGRPGEDRVARVHRAVEQAALQVAAQVAQAEGMRVLIISASGEKVTIDRGSDEGVVPGTELEIVRDGEVIARARIDRVRDATSTGTTFDVKPGEEVQAGDQGRITSVPETQPKPKKKKSNTAAIIAGVVILGIIIAALASGGGDGGGGAQLSLTVAAQQIPADGTSTTTITVTATDRKGNPLPDGKIVKLRTTLGLIAPGQVPLASGQAQATLTSSTTEGTATVTAILEGQRETIDVEFTGTGAGNVASIFLTRDVAEIPGDGVSEARITATIRDDQNNAVPDGTPVTFGTNRGMVVPGTTTTTGGVAQTSLRSEPTATDVTAIVTVSAGARQASITIKFTGAGTGPTQLNLVANTTNIPADGTSTAQLLATLVDSTGQPVVGETMTFTTTKGRLQVVGGTGWALTVNTTTDVAGTAEVLLRSTTTPDTATVTAAAPGVTTDTASVTISFSMLVITSVTADPAQVPVGGNKSSRVTATIVDSAGNPAPDGTVVEFSIVNQAQIPGATITSSSATAGGQAVAVFRSGTQVGTAQIRVVVPLTGATNDQTIIGITAGPPDMVTVAVSKTVASARSLSPENTINVTALVSDRFDNPVENGTAVRFDVEPDSRAVITGTGTTAGGFATAQIYATGQEGDVIVIASTTGAGGALIENRSTVVHMGGAPALVEIIAPNAASYSAASPLHLYTEADQAIVVRVTDGTGGPVDPLTQVGFQVDRGTIAPDPAPITNPVEGTASVLFRSDQPTPAGGADKIVATCEGVASAPLWIFIEVNPAL
jgi:hypothetical protein